jgi:hypothetical protein
MAVYTLLRPSCAADSGDATSIQQPDQKYLTWSAPQSGSHSLFEEGNEPGAKLGLQCHTHT